MTKDVCRSETSSGRRSPFLEKAVLNGQLSCTKGNMNKLAIDWDEGRIDTLDELIKEISFGENPGYICNGDSMANVNKGVVGFNIDGTKKAVTKNCLVQRAVNHGRPGSPLCGAYYNALVPGSTYPGYNGANARGFSVAGSRSVTLTRCEVDGLISMDGMTVGFDVHTNRKNVKLKACIGVNVEAFTVSGKSYLCPMDAVMAHLGTVKIRIKVDGQCFDDPLAPDGISAKVFDQGKFNIIGKDRSKCLFMTLGIAS